jgi:uncharacterized protein
MVDRDFNAAVLEEIEHRPWPMPESPWVMTQTWHDVLFAHWRVEPAGLRASVPSELEIDLFDGQAWVGIVPFHMTNVAPRGVPSIPWVSEFPELNVRTYVRVGDRPGIYFFSLYAGSAVAVAAARTLLNLPYYTASMNVAPWANGISYHSIRTDAPAARFTATYEASGRVFHSNPGTLEHFLTERYCLYHFDHSGAPYRLNIHHPPWPLQHAHTHITLNTMLDGQGLSLLDPKPLLHFAKRQDMVAWAPSGL